MEPKEIEIKIRLSDSPISGLQERAAGEADELLEEYGFERDRHLMQRDLYLSHPCRDLGETDEALRIRTVKDMDSGRTDTFITYKGPKLSNRSKSRDEIEIRIPGIEGMRELLYRLGFSKVIIVDKERRTYIKDEVEASIDMISDLGCFLELEMKSGEVKGPEERLLDIARELGFEKTERRSYMELLMEKLN